MPSPARIFHYSLCRRQDGCGWTQAHLEPSWSQPQVILQDLSYQPDMIVNCSQKGTQITIHTVPPLKLSSSTKALPQRSLKSKCTPFKRQRLKNTLYWTEDRFVWYLWTVWATSQCKKYEDIQIVQCYAMSRRRNGIQRLWGRFHKDTPIHSTDVSTREK